MVRISKDPEARKAEILDAAEALFAQKGYEATTISDIIEKVGVARGTVYYHFKSKEDMMNALVDRMGERLLAAGWKMARDQSIPVPERLVLTLLALQGPGEEEPVMRHLHRPQNALMHQRTHRLMLTHIPDILTEVVEDGIREGLFDTPWPYETTEMIVAYTALVFDYDSLPLSPEEVFARARALVFNLERLFGSQPGTFDGIFRMFSPT